MATYTRTIVKGRIINTLKWRGHTFTETWKTEEGARCDMTIETQAQEMFEDLTNEEFELIENLESLETYDLEGAICELEELEKRYRVS